MSEEINIQNQNEQQAVQPQPVYQQVVQPQYVQQPQPVPVMVQPQAIQMPPKPVEFITNIVEKILSILVFPVCFLYVSMWFEVDDKWKTMFGIFTGYYSKTRQRIFLTINLKGFLHS